VADSPTTVRDAARLLLNSLTSRASLAAAIAGQEGRDIPTTCGYPETLTVADFHAMIDRNGIAARANSVLPDESWRAAPVVYETEGEADVTAFETAWSGLFQNPNTNPWHYLHRADVESGKGYYGVILLGVADGKSLDQPVIPSPDNRLMFLRVFSQSSVRVKRFHTDPTSPNYGQPAEYVIDFATPDAEFPADADETVSIGTEFRETKATVHADRILHVADNRTNNEVYGVPRLQTVYNYLLDLTKVAGGSAEMFWQGAQPGYAVETHPGVLDPQVDKESLRDEFAGLRNGLQRYIALENMTVKSLAPQVADPTNHVTTQITLVCTSIGVPLRTFLGSEAGQLASETDKDNFNDRLTRRQNNYLTPMVILPFILRLIDLEVLPKPTKIVIDWADLNSMKEKDKAAISMQRVQALLQYVTSGAETVMPLREFLTKIMYFASADADAIIAAVKSGGEKYTEDLWKQSAEGTGAITDPTKKTGGLGKRNAQG
jgi:hypothetical protein